jgi:hypothetical protein
VKTALSDFRGLLVNEFAEFLNETMDDAGLLCTCMNCHHFDEPSECCAFAGSRPPARVIAFGCPAFKEREQVITVSGTTNPVQDEPAPVKLVPALRLMNYDDDIPF